MATPTDAARDRVLAARSDLAEEFQILEASGRAAVDIPAKIRRSPAKAAAVAGGIGFLALKGPQRLFGLGRRVVRGKDKPLPEGDAARGDREVPAQAGLRWRARARHARARLRRVRRSRRRSSGDASAACSSWRSPSRILSRAARASADWLFSPDKGSFERRIAEMRARVDPSYARPSKRTPPRPLPGTRCAGAHGRAGRRAAGRRLSDAR